MTEYFKGLYVAQLSEQRQRAIQAELDEIELTPEEIELAMCSRICDLMDTINISNVLGL